jgi:hypothetical protein
LGAVRIRVCADAGPLRRDHAGPEGRVEAVALRQNLLLGAALFVALAAACGGASWPRSYDDPAGDVELGPDITSVRVSRTETEVTFALRFATEAPLRVNESERWIDMVLIGVDVPPLGPEPVVPGGEWRGADFALGTHGPSQTGKLVRLNGRNVTDFDIVTNGSTLTFSIPSRALGDPGWFTFVVAAAREGDEAAAGGYDVVPALGTLRYPSSG